MTKITVTIEADSAEEAKDEAAKLFGLGGAKNVTHEQAEILSAQADAERKTRAVEAQIRAEQVQGAADLRPEAVLKEHVAAQAEDTEKVAAPKRGRAAKVEAVLTGEAKGAGQPAKPIPVTDDAAVGDPEVGETEVEALDLDDLPADSNKFNEWILDCVSRITSTGKADKISALKQIAAIMKEHADGARSGEQLYMKKDPAMVAAVYSHVRTLVDGYVGA